jgi:hypothetical protein
MLKGVRTHEQASPMERASYRVPWIQPEGATAAFIHEARIIDINLSTWTVDVRTQYDRRYFLNVQVASPYLHPINGEGIYAFPEVGANCLVCIPSDGPPPIVLAFMMPATSLGDVGTDEAPDGTAPSAAAISPTGSTYGGGRFRPKPGDIYLKGRDGNFCVLHRGGVLQIGSTALAQRLFIPINNVLTDISQNYHHYNTGGAINWTVATGPDIDDPPTCFKQSFRLHSNDARATIRVSAGTIADIVGLDPKEIGASEVTSEKIGAGSDPIIYEVVVAPDEIEADDGTIRPSTRASARLQFAFDRAGGGYLWAAGSVVLATKKKLVVRAEQDISVTTQKSLLLKAEDSARMQGGKLLELQADIIKIGAGRDRVAHVGSPVLVTIPPGQIIGSVVVPPATVPIPVLAGTIAPPGGITLVGTVSEGKSNILV